MRCWGGTNDCHPGARDSENPGPIALAGEALFGVRNGFRVRLRRPGMTIVGPASRAGWPRWSTRCVRCWGGTNDCHPGARDSENPGPIALAGEALFGVRNGFRVRLRRPGTTIVGLASRAGWSRWSTRCVRCWGGTNECHPGARDSESPGPIALTDEALFGVRNGFRARLRRPGTTIVGLASRAGWSRWSTRCVRCWGGTNECHPGARDSENPGPIALAGEALFGVRNGFRVRLRRPGMTIIGSASRKGRANRGSCRRSRRTSSSVATSSAPSRGRSPLRPDRRPRTT